MNKIQEQLEKLDRLHKTKREYMWGLIGQCLLLALLVSSYVISIITKDIVCLAIVSVFMGIVLFCVLNTATMLVAVRKRIIEETDKTCEQLHEESKKMFMSALEQIDKEFQERKAMAQKKAEENKVEAEKKAEAENKPIKKVNTTSSVKKKADPKKLPKKENKKS